MTFWIQSRRRNVNTCSARTCSEMPDCIMDNEGAVLVSEPQCFAFLLAVALVAAGVSALFDIMVLDGFVRFWIDAFSMAWLDIVALVSSSEKSKTFPRKMVSLFLYSVQEFSLLDTMYESKFQKVNVGYLSSAWLQSVSNDHHSGSRKRALGEVK